MNDGYEEVRIGPKKVKIPEEWQRVSLESISKNSGQYGANQSAIPFDENEYRYIRVTDLTENGHLSNEEKKSIPKEDNEKYELKNGDIVFARTGTPGLTYVFNENDSNIDYAFAGYLIRFELKDNIDSNYLSYYTQSYHYWSWIKSTQRSTTLSNINASEFRTLPIIKPSSSEQRRIAEILSIVDDAIQKTDEVIEKAERLKKGLMQNLLTKGIGHDEFKEVQIGPKTVEIPERWEVSVLSDVSDIKMGQSPPGSSYNENGNGMPFFQGNAEFNDIYPIVEKWTTDPKKTADKNDILISVRAPVGEINIAPKECCIGRGLSSIKANKKSLNKYLFYILKENKDQLKSFSQGSTFKSINSDVLQNFSIPIPPLEEQKKILNIISKIDNKIQKEKSHKEKLQTLKKGLMQDLLTGKVRVNT